ncbi:PorV/PorQ family protein, partial [bacterium]|nr:PorV/PorQ family protein [bacterium]
MKRFIVASLITLFTITSYSFSQSEAGSIFLLIAPSARAGGMGEAHVGLADDAYASYWNPAGLGFLEGTELALMHVNWLPNLADDMAYDFFAMRKSIPNLGTVGGHLIYLNLGEQTRTDEIGTELGKFSSYMFAFNLSYSTKINEKSAFGLNAKVSYQHLTDQGAGAEEGKGSSTDFGFDLGYMKKEFLLPRLNLGATITNIGPKVSFIDPAQADPQPTNFTLGLKYQVLNSEYNKLSVVWDINKLLVASYPDMDWDGDGFIGGWDENGSETTKNAFYNNDGKQETAHTDPLWKALYTSWFDDWFLGGDIDMASPGSLSDGIIGGWNWNDNNSNGKIDVDEGEMVESEGGKYNEYGQKEVGSGDARSINDELNQIVHNIGLEYWYSNVFAIRLGYIYDYNGKLFNPTMGIGLRYGGYGFDFGYTFGEPGHPLENTMR